MRRRGCCCRLCCSGRQCHEIRHGMFCYFKKSTRALSSGVRYLSGLRIWTLI